MRIAFLHPGAEGVAGELLNRLLGDVGISISLVIAWWRKSFRRRFGKPAAWRSEPQAFFQLPIGRHGSKGRLRSRPGRM